MSRKSQGASTTRPRGLGSVPGAEIPLPEMDPHYQHIFSNVFTDSPPLLHSDVPEATNLPDQDPCEFSWSVWVMDSQEDFFGRKIDKVGLPFD
jgi:hypothetical protein